MDTGIYWSSSIKLGESIIMQYLYMLWYNVINTVLLKVVKYYAKDDLLARNMLLAIEDNNKHLTPTMISKAITELDEIIYEH